jgi:ABC-type multidrug transport system fused ATPase/permease subunit
MRKPRILLLDEATSALDSTSERVVQRALENVIRVEARSTVIIAHRLSTVQNADLIVVLEKGHIVEGPASHETLLSLPGGKYAQMWADARARGALGGPAS